MASPFRLRVSLDQGDFPTRLLGLLARVRDTGPAMEDIARALANATEDAFQAQSSPFGDDWPDLRPATEARRAARGHWPGPILQVSGGAGLAGSVTHGSDRASAYVGASKVYAAIHQFGGTGDMAPGPAGVPERPYLPVDADGNIPEDLREEILEILVEHLER